MVNDGLVLYRLTSILNNGIELVGVKNSGWMVDDEKCEWVDSSDQSIQVLSLPEGPPRKELQGR